MTNYGYANGWDSIPEEIKKCRELKHKTVEKKLGNCHYEYTCPICKYLYKVDSSD